MPYAIVIEESWSGFGAYVPDLPGCIAVGESESEVRTLIRAAIEFHLETMQADGQNLPAPTSRVACADMARAAKTGEKS